MMNISAKSEFAGLSYDEQVGKIRRSLDIFNENGVIPQIWVAPSHSFDSSTLRALLVSGITTLSDGFALYPHRDRSNMFWIPQQLWRFRAMPCGVWTVCLHHNKWSSADIAKFRKDIEAFHARIAEFDEIEAQYASRQIRLSDQIAKATIAIARRLRTGALR